MASGATIIERPSIAANGAPFCDEVIRSVARPIEGAAPNRPAKLLGRKVSPSAANAETASPPIRNRKPYSSIVPILEPSDSYSLASFCVSGAPPLSTSWDFKMPNFVNLPPFTEDGDVHVVVETPRGSRAKFDYDPKLETFRWPVNVP
jgi:hypothetical protein